MGIGALSFNTVMMPCSGNGDCISQRQAAYLQGYSYSDWDADMIYGCSCQPGWQGIACEKKSCVKGDDPVTIGVDEVQLIECTCTTCKGGLYLSYNGSTTNMIPYDASEELVAYRLQELQQIMSISARFYLGTTLCSTSGSLTKITFRLPQGDAPTLSITSIGGLVGTFSIVADGKHSSLMPSLFSVNGTRELIECSGRGNCDYSTGTCQCLEGFQSSDGFGNFGTRGDCGYRLAVNVTFENRNMSGLDINDTLGNAIDYRHLTYQLKDSQGCPFVSAGGICSGRGVCQQYTSKCFCDTGYGGLACEKVLCRSSPAWFAGNVIGGTPHVTSVECGGIGECDYSSGICTSCGGSFGVFGGNACQYLTCPRSSKGVACAGTGQCVSMRNLAAVSYNDVKQLANLKYTTPWDADSILGCACYRAISIDNHYESGYQVNWNYDLPYVYNDTSKTTRNIFYRGPYSFAATDFTGYMCTSARCPTGDNPATRNDVNEIQMMVCRANNGTFRLEFRQNYTMPISFNATTSMLERKLEMLPTIHAVSVTLGGSGAFRKRVCDPSGDIIVYIEFISEFGNLPMLTADITGIATHNGAINITEYQRGTKEDVECSAMGICNDSTGVCTCIRGFGSSNSTSGFPGEKGDCSFRNPFSTYDPN